MDSFDTEPKTPEPVHDETPLGMKWYKFLRYFGLILGGIVSFSQGILYLSGMIYVEEMQISPEQVYGFYGMGLKALDSIYGAALICIAILIFVLRDKIAKFKSDTIRFLKMFYAVELIVAISYLLIASAIVKASLFNAGTISPIIINCVIMMANISYFNHRAHLFVK